MIVIKDAVISFIEKIKSAEKLHKIIAVCLAAAVVLIITVASLGVKITFNVKSNGEVLANINSTSVYNEAMEKALGVVGLEKFEKNETYVVPTLSISKEFDSVDSVCDAILSNSSEVYSGYVLTVENEKLAYLTDRTELDKAINARLSAFNIENAECKNSFAKNLQVTAAYFSVDSASNISDAVNQINKLDVVTVATTKEIVDVSFNTKTRKDSSKYAGYEKVITKGVNGQTERVEKITYLNGEASNDSVVVETVIKEPVTEVIIVGTKNAYVTSTPKNAAASGFKWPLEIRGTLTSYWGDGRNHGGIDIGVPTGTKVVAVKAGTVVEARYASDYGYYVTIDHGNGVKTKYAHNSQNVVEVGQKVKGGQVIALSGNTGRSTGPHLHFEVIINGNRVNPGKYIRL